MRLLGDPPNWNNVPPTFWDAEDARLQAALTPEMQRMALSGAQTLLESTNVGIDWALIADRAAAWASQHAADLVKLADDYTRETAQRLVNESVTRIS